jgi:anhydro-N-acetylmuramic acid kinase
VTRKRFTAPNQPLVLEIEEGWQGTHVVMAKWLQQLASLAERPSYVVGMISGTSADAIEVAVCEITSIKDAIVMGDVEVNLKKHVCFPHEPDIHQWIARATSFGAREFAEIHRRLGGRFAQACMDAIAASGLRLDQVDLVGSHGQTIYHHSQTPGADRCTLQLGDADCIAELTGLPVVSDFRARDIAAGGEGAPISPIADLALFRPVGPHGRRAVLNLGGIANLTVLDDDPFRILGFDVGPGNALLDRLARRLTNGKLSFDRDGRLASGGTVNQAMLSRILARDPFLKRSPPKSTGFEMYGDAFLESLIQEHGRADADLLATVSDFTARAIALALSNHITAGQQPGELVVAGGGVMNLDLMRRIAKAVAPRVVTDSSKLGVPAQAREAMAFAVIAHRTALGLPSSWPALTGVSHPVVLGKLSFPNLTSFASPSAEVV